MKTERTLFLSVGIDVGADFSLMAIASPTQEIVSRNYKIFHSSLNSLQGAIDRIRTLEAQHGMNAKVFMESTSIYHNPLYYRLKNEGLEVFVLNPLITNANTNIDVRGVHNDKFDAQKIALLGLKPTLKTSIVPDDDVAAVKVLVREYHSMKKEYAKYICRLKSQLRQTFPQYLPLFSQVHGKISLELLARYTTAETILSVDKEELISVIMKFGGKGRVMAEEKCERLLQAAADAALFGHANVGNIYLIRHYVDMIRLMDTQTNSLLAQIRESITAQPHSLPSRQAALLQTIPGVGFLSAVTLVCEIGNFHGFRRPKQLFAYFGLDPKVRQSGNFTGTELKISKRGSPFARRCLYMLALQSVSLRKNGEPKNPVIRTYYEEKCKTKARMTALGAVMHKVCNIIFAVLRDEKPFAIITPEEHRKAYSETLKLAA